MKVSALAVACSRWSSLWLLHLNAGNDHPLAVASGARVWTAEQLHAFLTAARSHRLFAFYRLAAYTGARRGELLHLRWHALDFDAAEVTFGGSTAVVRGQRVDGTTKTGRSRTISIDSETVTMLQEHRRRQAEERLAAGSAWTDSGGLVFTSRWGEPLYPDTVTALITKLINRYNQSATPPAKPLPHARLHDLRHLHATTLQVSGVAFDASFGSSGERWLPAPQRRGLLWGWLAA